MKEEDLRSASSHIQNIRDLISAVALLSENTAVDECVLKIMSQLRSLSTIVRESKISSVLPEFSEGNIPTLADAEKDLIMAALRANHGNRADTAKVLGIGERTLYRKLIEIGVTFKDSHVNKVASLASRGLDLSDIIRATNLSKKTVEKCLKEVAQGV